MSKVGAVIESIPDSTADSPVDKEELFLQTMNDINMAVHAFVSQFQTLHSVNIHYCNLEREASTQAGSYFCSGVVRLNFTYDGADRHCSSSVILKVPRLAALEDYSRRMLLFDKEKYVYEKLLPLMYVSWTREKLTPEFYGCTDSGILIMENLQESKFYVQERGTLISLADCLVVIKTFAQFHALSLKHVDDLQVELDALTVANRGAGEWAQRIHPPIVRKIREYVVSRLGVSTREKFDDFMRNISSIINSGYEPPDGKLKVILHGDTHYHNICFKNDKRFKVTDCKLIDFQSCRVGSPIVDLMSFLVTSVEHEVFENNFKTIFRTYLREFESTLKELDMEWPQPYSLRDLLDDFEKYKLFSFYFFTSNVPCYWAGEVYPCQVDENSIDTVLRSTKFRDLCEGWLNLLM